MLQYELGFIKARSHPNSSLAHTWQELAFFGVYPQKDVFKYLVGFLGYIM